MLEMLAEIMEIPSEKGEPAPNAPFGVECRKALDWFLNTSKQMGFKTHDLDGYCGYAEYGEGEEMAILTHLDVVPVGKLTDWIYPPFSGEEVDGKIYGRGTAELVAEKFVEMCKDLKNGTSQQTPEQ